MSGPATASFAFGPLGALSLAAMALREARQMGREYQDVLHELQERATALNRVQFQARQTKATHRQAIQLQTQRLQAKIAQLQDVALALGIHPQDTATPQNVVTVLGATPSSEAAWEQLINALTEEVARLHACIATARQQSSQAAHALLTSDELPPVEDALHAFMVQRALHAHLDASQSQHICDSVARILARVDLDDGEPLPQELAALGRDMALAPNLERAEMLGLELRLRVQNQCDAKAGQRADKAMAAQLLETMGDDTPAAVRVLLEAVVSGAQALLPDTLALAQQAARAIDTQRQQAEQEAAAYILEQSLRDLGYAVDGVADTLFVEGGVAHFQRHGWGEYFVRVRVQADEKTLNFNVVRARGAQESAERKRLDYLAEDRWCSEFPKLLDTLAARGINLNVTRLLGAGELPVQAVDPASVPQLVTEEAQRRAAQVHAMKPKD